MARLGFFGACPTETETSRREAGFHMVFFGLQTHLYGFYIAAQGWRTYRMVCIPQRGAVYQVYQGYSTCLTQKETCCMVWKPKKGYFSAASAKKLPIFCSRGA